MQISKNPDFFKAVEYVHGNSHVVHQEFLNVEENIPTLYVHPFVISSAKMAHLFAVGISFPDGRSINYPITYLGAFDLSSKKNVAVFVVILGELLNITDPKQLSRLKQNKSIQTQKSTENRIMSKERKCMVTHQRDGIEIEFVLEDDQTTQTHLLNENKRINHVHHDRKRLCIKLVQDGSGEGDRDITIFRHLKNEQVTSEQGIGMHLAIKELCELERNIFSRKTHAILMPNYGTNDITLTSVPDPTAQHICQ